VASRKHACKMGNLGGEVRTGFNTKETLRGRRLLTVNKGGNQGGFRRLRVELKGGGAVGLIFWRGGGKCSILYLSYPKYRMVKGGEEPERTANPKEWTSGGRRKKQS